LAITEQSIEQLSPNVAAFKAGKQLMGANNWLLLSKSDRTAWGEIKGSGKSPYQVAFDPNTLGYKCNCPSRQFPCKHSIALMLVYSQSVIATNGQNEEPDWVKQWMDKRLAKAEKKEESSEIESESSEKNTKASEKNQKKRYEEAQAGTAELQAWLKDMVRIGILELPQKPAKYFESMAARMIDAKAPGLAGWVKSFTKIDYDNVDEWQGEALTIIAKLHLLIKTFQNHDNLSPIWQTTVKNLVGWNQSSKELAENQEAETIKDQWLVVGQETETVDDIVVQRNWLAGVQTGRQALILNFATRFSNFETPIIAGSIINAEVAYFPSVTPLRAIIKRQLRIEEKLDTLPSSFDSLADVFQKKADLLTLNPWTNEMVVIIKNVGLAGDNKRWLMYDSHKHFIPIAKGFDVEKIMTWMAHSGNKPQNIACLLRNQQILPFGVFENLQYTLL